jgi:hypothetical protein
MPDAVILLFSKLGKDQACSDVIGLNLAVSPPDHILQDSGGTNTIIRERSGHTHY